ncbi:MAG: transposase [Deltaproteobacteria bacterium]|nr:transposase [Deltaproteobacteria bacterium]
MPRMSRQLADGLIYHVINRGNDKQVVFRKKWDYEVFLELMGMARERYPLKVFAYCLMPNHFHFVASQDGDISLSSWIQWLMTTHVRRYNRHYERSGHLWQGRFKSFPVQDDEHLLVLMRYVEGNPVRSGLVSTARDWKWSSHGENTGAVPRNLTDVAPRVLPENWTRYVDVPWTTSGLDCVRECVNRQAPFGSDVWRAKISREFNLESTIRPRGRPRK